MIAVEQLVAGDRVELRHPLTGEVDTFKVTGAYVTGEHVELGVLRLTGRVGQQYVTRRWIRTGTMVDKLCGWHDRPHPCLECAGD